MKLILGLNKLSDPFNPRWPIFTRAPPLPSYGLIPSSGEAHTQNFRLNFKAKYTANIRQIYGQYPSLKRWNCPSVSPSVSRSKHLRRINLDSFNRHLSDTENEKGYANDVEAFDGDDVFVMVIVWESVEINELVFCLKNVVVITSYEIMDYRLCMKVGIKQGRNHGYPIRLRVGRGTDKKH